MRYYIYLQRAGPWGRMNMDIEKRILDLGLELPHPAPRLALFCLLFDIPLEMEPILGLRP
jgi:hypothetical protein